MLERMVVRMDVVSATVPTDLPRVPRPSVEYFGSANRIDKMAFRHSGTQQGLFISRTRALGAAGGRSEKKPVDSRFPR